ncbi:MAG: glutamate 5-kinase [Bacillota bacterium]|uniref:glutamate 5-kinase n=1 Tax=Desulfurispora thermophila TaxID=265470 RepID=UPI00037CD695|nr:glutamate 5-kinase [Desulfurispora thermophila]
MIDCRSKLAQAHRVVVKIGSSSLAYGTGKPNLTRLESLVRQLSDLHNRGLEVILVTSGAVGLGLSRLGFTRRPRNIPEKQAAAAVGQGLLMHLYEKLFAEYGITVGQVLLTREDFTHRSRFLNARNTLYTMLSLAIIPVINENDTVAVDEIKLGDNDTLAAMVASAIDADLLIILSDIDGLYTANPQTDPNACLISEVTEITPELERQAGGAGSRFGTGGMITKLSAARLAMHSGMPMVLAAAACDNVLRRIIGGENVGTIFWPCSKLENKKRWIAYGSAVHGALHVDAGAAEAITHHGKSLLPSGITAVQGEFELGNTVSIIDPGGKELARGIVNYSSREVRLIMGRKTGEIERILGYKDFDEVVHRNNLALL